jgi:hypothetical protein
MRTTITSTSNPAVIEVHLAEAQVEHEYSGDVIADVNRAGNWINGLELLGSGLQFSLERAISSLPRESAGVSVKSPQKSVVTYDEDANAGFLYLPYASPTNIEQEQQSNPLLLKSSYSIEDDKAVFALAGDKTLVSIRFALPSDHRLDTFLHLFGSKGE